MMTQREATERKEEVMLDSVYAKVPLKNKNKIPYLYGRGPSKTQTAQDGYEGNQGLAIA
jgi:hypothetical protein